MSAIVMTRTTAEVRPAGKPIAVGHTRRRRDGTLSAIERQMLEWLAGGLTNAQIGERMCRSEKTVRNRLTRLYVKLPAANRAEAVGVYLRRYCNAGVEDRDSHPSV
jgi:DNA-binding NarL/FixJ family response regulator